jgi:hypothetical protein
MVVRVPHGYDFKNHHARWVFHVKSVGAGDVAIKSARRIPDGGPLKLPSLTNQLKILRKAMFDIK